MTCEPLPTSPYSPKNSPSRSGGDSRTMSTRSATWTPPRPLPRIAPATRKIAMPGVVPLSPSDDDAQQQPDDPRREDRDQRPLRAEPVDQLAPAEARDDRHDRQRRPT